MDVCGLKDEKDVSRKLEVKSGIYDEQRCWVGRRRHLSCLCMRERGGNQSMYQE